MDNKDISQLDEHVGCEPVGGSEHTSGQPQFSPEDRLRAQELAREDPCWCLHRRGSLP